MAQARFVAEHGRADVRARFEGRIVDDHQRGRCAFRKAREVVAEAGRYLGVAVASLVNVFDPDIVVIGGGVTAGAGELLVEPAREEMRRRALPPMNRTPVTPAALGSDAGMIGAAQMVLEELAGA